MARLVQILLEQDLFAEVRDGGPNLALLGCLRLVGVSLRVILLHDDVGVGGVEHVQVLEAVIGLELVVVEAEQGWLVRVDGVDGVEHELLRVLGMGRQEATRGPWEEIAPNLARVDQLARAEQGVVWVALLCLENQACALRDLVLRPDRVLSDIQVVRNRSRWVALLPPLVFLYLFHYCTLAHVAGGGGCEASREVLG